MSVTEALCQLRLAFPDGIFRLSPIAPNSYLFEAKFEDERENRTVTAFTLKGGTDRMITLCAGLEQQQNDV